MSLFPCFSAVMAGFCLFVAGCRGIHPEKTQLPAGISAPAGINQVRTNHYNKLNPGTLPGSSASLTLTLAQARQLTLDRNPYLAASWHHIQARASLVQQAGIPANPELFAELEEFAGTRDFSGFQNASGRLGLSREFQTGGRQKLAIHSAEMELQFAISEYQALQNELSILVETRFYAVFFLQQSLQLKEERLKVLEETGKVIQGRVNAGDHSPFEALKHRSELTEAAMELRQIRRELQTARVILASSWGEASPQFPAVEAEWQKIPSFSEDLLQKTLEGSPAWRKNRLAIAHSEKELARAESEKYPNLEIEGGFQHFREDDSLALFFGLSLPLPIFDRNQGNIAAAGARLRQVMAESAGGDLTLQSALRNSLMNWQNTAAALTELKNDTLPAAREYYDAIYAAWRAGEADILELFEARQSWLAKREEQLQLHRDSETARLELMAILGIDNLNELSREKE